MILSFFLFVYRFSMYFVELNGEVIREFWKIVLKYIFDDGGWFVLRPSGTEPKLKIYIAIKGKTREEATNFIATLKAEILNMIDNI